MDSECFCPKPLYFTHFIQKMYNFIFFGVWSTGDSRTGGGAGRGAERGGSAKVGSRRREEVFATSQPGLQGRLQKCCFLKML